MKNPNKKQTLTCAVCGKNFSLYISQITRGKGVYCSSACYNTSRPKKSKQICEYCHKEFLVFPYILKQGKGNHCSRECYLNSHNANYTCSACGKIFQAELSQRIYKETYCSRKCYTPPGIVRALENRFWSKVNQANGDDSCWEWTGARNDSNYGILNSKKKNEPRKYQLAHRVSWEIHFGTIPDKLFVCHHCDNPPCVNPKHLFIGTLQQNNEDKCAKNRQAKGENHTCSKLTDTKVLEIRRRFANGEQYSTLAKEFHTSTSNIQSIVHRITWKHI